MFNVHIFDPCNVFVILYPAFQRLHKELPLSAEELEDVFDSLDLDRNGRLTLEEFSSGFSELKNNFYSRKHTQIMK